MHCQLVEFEIRDGSRTVFASLEELVCVPADDAAFQAAPAPLHDAAKDLSLCQLWS